VGSDGLKLVVRQRALTILLTRPFGTSLGSSASIVDIWGEIAVVGTFVGCVVVCANIGESGSDWGWDFLVAVVVGALLIHLDVVVKDVPLEVLIGERRHVDIW